MGEEKKNAEELKTKKKKPKANEAKKPGSRGEDKKEEESKDNTPTPPPTEIVLKVIMNCDGCADKVRQCLKGFPGVDEVITDCKTHKVFVKGEKADPQKVLERVQRKRHRQVELISPILKPPAEVVNKPEEKEKPSPEEKKEEPKIIMVILRVHMHCKACPQEIKRCILKMKGVKSAEPDLNKSEVRVKGVFEPAKLVKFVLKRMGKQAVIVKEEVAEKKQKAEKKAYEGEKEKKERKGEEKKEEKKERVQRNSRKKSRKVKFNSNKDIPKIIAGKQVVTVKEEVAEKKQKAKEKKANEGEKEKKKGERKGEEKKGEAKERVQRSRKKSRKVKFDLNKIRVHLYSPSQ